MPGRDGREILFPRREPLPPPQTPPQQEGGGGDPGGGENVSQPGGEIKQQRGGGGATGNEQPDPEPTLPDELPLPPIPPPPNSPLAIPGTFAIPGTPNAAPFRTSKFFQNRVVRGPQREGPGSTLLGGSAGFSGLVGDTAGGDFAPSKEQNSEEDLIRRIVLGLGRGRR